MPVFLEHIEQPSPADWQDIEKIHQDTHANGLTFNRPQLEEWLAAGGWIMAGRFNDRLIGLILAKHTHDQIELSQAAVRTLTQQRGVMHQLLHHVCQWSQQENKPLYAQVNNTALQQSLSKRGFQINQQNCYYPPV